MQNSFDWGHIDWDDIYPRLLLFVSNKLGRLPWRLKQSPEDYVDEAIRKTVEGIRRWNADQKDLFDHLMEISCAEIQNSITVADLTRAKNSSLAGKAATAFREEPVRARPVKASQSDEFLEFLDDRHPDLVELARLILSDPGSRTPALSRKLNLPVANIGEQRKRLKRAAQTTRRDCLHAVEPILAALDINEIINMSLGAVNEQVSGLGMDARMPQRLRTRVASTAGVRGAGPVAGLTADDEEALRRIKTLALPKIIEELEVLGAAHESSLARSKEYIALLTGDASDNNRNYTQLQERPSPAQPRLPAARLTVLDELAGQFYEAALTGEGWEDALGNTAALLGASSAAIVISNKKTDAPTEFLIGGDVSGEVASLYTERYGALDLASQVLKKLPIGRVDSCHRHLEKSQVENSPYYRDFLLPQGGRYSSGARLFDDGREWGRLGLQTNERQGPIEGRSFQALVWLTPHVQKAVRQLRLARSSRNAGLLEALQQMGVGAVIVEGDGGVVGMNAAAQRHLGRGVNRSQDLLTATHRDVREAFGQMLASVAGMSRATAGECSLALLRSEGRPLVARLSPLFEPWGATRRRALVLVKLIDLDERTHPASGCLREVFGLTPAEARLAIELTWGGSLKEVAIRLGVADGTVRGQIKSIFQKTETGGQRELIALLERLAAAEGR